MEEDANETSGDKPNTEDIKEEDASVDDEYFENGLTSVEAGLRLEKYGRNEIPETKTSKWMVSKRYRHACRKECVWVWELIVVVMAEAKK